MKKNPFLRPLRLGFKPTSDKAMACQYAAHGRITVLSCVSQRANRNGIAIVEPKGRLRPQAAPGCRSLRDNQSFGRSFRVWNRFWGAHL